MSIFTYFGRRRQLRPHRETLRTIARHLSSLQYTWGGDICPGWGSIALANNIPIEQAIEDSVICVRNQDPRGLCHLLAEAGEQIVGLDTLPFSFVPNQSRRIWVYGDSEAGLRMLVAKCWNDRACPMQVVWVKQFSDLSEKTISLRRFQHLEQCEQLLQHLADVIEPNAEATACIQLTPEDWTRLNDLLSRTEWSRV